MKHTNFDVIKWDTGKIAKSFEKLSRAKKYCRSLGHTGEDNSGLKGYPPIAFVSDGEGCVYNPRFKKT